MAREHPERRISLLFDLFVVNQHVRRLLGAALADAPLTADEYAVYGLLFEQGPLTATEMSKRLGMPLTTLLDYLRTMSSRRHLRRRPHPSDGRAQHLELTLTGVGAHRRTNEFWEAMRTQLELALEMPADDVRRALHALDQAAVAALRVVEAEGKAG